MRAGLSGVHFAWRGRILAGMLALLAVARLLSDAPLRSEGLVLVGLGALYRLHAGRYIAAHSNGLAMAAGPLALAGPYAIGRHPLYLSNIVTSAGLVLFANCLPVWGMALLLAAVCIHHDLLARAEESHLASAHGERYLGYMQVTPRWLGIPRRESILANGFRPDPIPEGVPSSLRRQGGNLVRTGISTLLLWGLSLP
jgi:protein-S-isoprenylcysteine O-methyltransferase Ste14